MSVSPAELMLMCSSGPEPLIALRFLYKETDPLLHVDYVAPNNKLVEQSISSNTADSRISKVFNF